MKVAAAAFGLLSLTSCVRAAESVVREQAATAFACADYALHVEEVGPDVYRAAGCGQELIYACRPTAPSHPVHAGGLRPAGPGSAPEPPPADALSTASADVGDEAVMACERRPR